VEGAEKTFDRDLWDAKDSAVKLLGSTDEVLALKKTGKASVVVVYAPWCKFCKAMEGEYEKFARESGLDVYKFRGDEERDFVQANMNTKSFPTINVVKADGSVVKYESEERDVASLKKWVESLV
jgi:thiol-disulfide isomerase/thioredoxin